MSNRITQTDRDKALVYIKHNVVHEASQKVWLSYCEELSGAVLASIEKKYPKKDMKILQVYGYASDTDTIKFHTRNYQSEGVIKLKEKFLHPAKYRGDYLSNEWSFIREVTGLTDNQMERVVGLYTTHKSATEDLVHTYKKLFDSCKTFKQLAEMWPETTTLFPDCLTKKSVALIPLSEAELKFIRADSKKRMAKK